MLLNCSYLRPQWERVKILDITCLDTIEYLVKKLAKSKMVTLEALVELTRNDPKVYF